MVGYLRVLWLLATYFRSSLNFIMRVPKGIELTPEYAPAVAELVKTILPVNPRSDGAVFDMFVSNPDVNAGHPLEEITVPVLIINSVDDPLTLDENARSAEERIPGAKLVTIESGGHMLLGREERIRSGISTFLREYTANRP